MRVPVSWLSEFIDTGTDVETLADALTGLGLKVEAIHRPGAGLEGVFVAEVLAIKDHPKAGNLILVDVATADKEHHVVCGARNFSVGDKVPAALPGARLVDGMVIETRIFRGEVSEGMLCSEKELGLSDDHSGILVLGSDAETGADVRDVPGLFEVVLEFEIKPNRPDAMSILGVARDLAALSGAELVVPEMSVAERGPAIGGITDVSLDDAHGCPRYLARVISGVSVRPSPDWVQRRLQLAGFRPVSNVVDATNYALLVTGHPMHAFDLDTLDGRRIVVRRAAKGEKITTIDDEERELDPEDLVIADASRTVAIAGVMGGKGTEVTGRTKDVLLESAYFDPISITRTSKRHGLRSEASARFERGADPNGVGLAADYATMLIVEWAGGDVATGVIDRYPKRRSPWEVTLRAERANLILGTSMKSGEMTRSLNRLGLAAVEEGGLIRAAIPTRRPDISIEEDLVEEIARLSGYGEIPTRLPSGRNRAGSLTLEQAFVRRVRRLLAGAGVWEAQTTSLVGPDDLERMGYGQDHEALQAIRLVNALSREESMLRTSLLPGLLLAVATNVARRNLSVRLFEIGHCFLPASDVLPAQPLKLGVVVQGPIEDEWFAAGREMDFYDLKGVVETLVAGLRIEGVSYAAVEEGPFHPTRAAAIMLEGDRVGVIGEISPEVAGRYDLSHRAIALELELMLLFDRAKPPEVREPARFPAALLDLAIEVPEHVPAAAVIATARAAGGDYLEDVRIFDVYRGEQIGEGRKSIAMSLWFRHPERTLTDPESIAARDAIALAIESEHGGRVRS